MDVTNLMKFGSS